MSDTTFSRVLLPVIHPLDDVPEQKLYRPELGRMRMTPRVRALLLTLQLYLAGMCMLLAWRVMTGI